MSSKSWKDMEQEVDKLDQSDNEYKSTVGFLTDDEIAVLTHEVNAPARSVHEVRAHSQPMHRMRGMHVTSDYNDVHNNLYDHAPAHLLAKPADKAAFHKQSILRKLMIAQRKQFQARKEQGEMAKLRRRFMNDTSASNFSQASEYVKFNDVRPAKAGQLGDNYK